MYLKKHFLGSSLAQIILMFSGMGAIILFAYFRVFPNLIKSLPEDFITKAELIKSRLTIAIIAYFIVVPIVLFFAWKKAKQFKVEENQIQKTLSLNPNDSGAKEKLKELERNKNRFINIFEPIFIIVSGAIVAFIAWAFMALFFAFFQPPLQIP